MICHSMIYAEHNVVLSWGVMKRVIIEPVSDFAQLCTENAKKQAVVGFHKDLSNQVWCTVRGGRSIPVGGRMEIRYSVGARCIGPLRDKRGNMFQNC